VRCQILEEKRRAAYTARRPVRSVRDRGQCGDGGPVGAQAALESIDALRQCAERASRREIQASPKRLEPLLSLPFEYRQGILHAHHDIDAIEFGTFTVIPNQTQGGRVPGIIGRGKGFR